MWKVGVALKKFKIISSHRIRFVVYNLDMFLLAVKATSEKKEEKKIQGGQYGRVAEM